MKTFSGNRIICCFLTIRDTELLVSGLRAYHEKLLTEGQMTNQVKDDIIVALVSLELALMDEGEEIIH